jgi:hypothetical protein
MPPPMTTTCGCPGSLTALPSQRLAQPGDQGRPAGQRRRICHSRHCNTGSSVAIDEPEPFSAIFQPLNP